MFVCCECGCTFEDAKEYVETHNLDSPPYEHFYASPCCIGNYVEAMRCDSCGEYITTETYVEINGEKFCENCFEIKELI